MEILFFLLCGEGGVFKMTSRLCKGISVADGHILLFSDLSLQEKKLAPHDGLISILCNVSLIENN